MMDELSQAAMSRQRTEGPATPSRTFLLSEIDRLKAELQVAEMEIDRLSNLLSQRVPLTDLQVNVAAADPRKQVPTAPVERGVGVKG